MNVLRGEKPPVASSSRSQIDRSESCREGRWLAYAFKSSTASGGTSKLTSSSPYGGIRVEGLTGIGCVIIPFAFFDKVALADGTDVRVVHVPANVLRPHQGFRMGVLSHRALPLSRRASSRGVFCSSGRHTPCHHPPAGFCRPAQTTTGTGALRMTVSVTLAARGGRHHRRFGARIMITSTFSSCATLRMASAVSPTVTNVRQRSCAADGSQVENR